MSRVLIVTKDADSRGGVANYFRLFFERYGAREPGLLRFDIGSRAADYDRRTRRPLAYVTDYLRDLIRLQRLLRAQPDLALVQVNPSLIPVPLWRDGLILALARAHRRRTLVFVRGWRDEVAARLDHAPWRGLFRRTHGRADRVVALADRFAERLAALGVPRDRLTVSRTMYDGRLIQPRAGRTAVPRLLYVGRLSRRKGVFELVEALGRLKTAGVACEARINGHAADATVMPQLQEALARHGLADRCAIGPYLDGPAKFEAYARHDVFVLPSHHEGCPNALLEAMGAGMDIVATAVGAVPEIVRAGVNGHLCPPRDATALAAALARACADPAAMTARGSLNAAEAAQRYECEPILTQMHALYRSLCPP